MIFKHVLEIAELFSSVPPLDIALDEQCCVSKATMELVYLLKRWI